MVKTYTYKLKPNKTIENKFNKWLGITRFVYNCCKDLSEQSYKKGLRLTEYDISLQLTQAKKEFTWVSEVNAQTLCATVKKHDVSMKKFFKGNGYPKWASKKKWKSVPFKSIKTTHNAFKLPSFGVVKVFKFKKPNGVLKTATLVQEADGIYLKIDIEKSNKPNVENQNIVGIDMGIKYLLTTSDGEFVENPKFLFSYLKKLRIESRKLSRMKKGGSNYRKQVSVLQRLHQKIRRTRKDFLHKESTKLASNYGIIVRENLNIKGMSKNSKLSKHILDCSWGMFFKMLEHKTTVIKVSPTYTSQQCSKCGHTCKENRKTQSLFECVKCGYTENADLQACFNILQRGQSLMEVKTSR